VFPTNEASFMRGVSDQGVSTKRKCRVAPWACRGAFYNPTVIHWSVAMQLEFTPRGDGVLLRVQAVPGARRNAILGVRNGALRVAVTQVAEKGKANKALIGVLAQELGLRPGQIALFRGAGSPQKLFLFRAMTDARLLQLIRDCLESRTT
jgi:uncharacterized protein (TIGR00251 family)